MSPAQASAKRLLAPLCSCACVTNSQKGRLLFRVCVQLVSTGIAARHAPEAYVCSCKNMLKRTASCFFGIILSAWAKHSKGLAPRMERSLHRGASPARCARP
eukprot:scaffold202625_cov20-Tisochrysis_lutea.AAC.3